ncbi:MAG: ABC transporter substrate-binding protein [Candidatus Lokiarchaeota archaeon]|nr:ABC transporter substrate-binding protein [Candidatus Lokiarchaeota archaeon]
MRKKNLAIIILSIGLTCSGVFNIVTLSKFIIVDKGVLAPNRQEVIVAASHTIEDLDPAYSYNIADSAVIDNVCETLYAINWSDPSFPIVPLLATVMPTISSDGLEYTIPLRMGVRFHDGTVFNAQTAKWTLDRYSFFINWSGNNYLPAPFNISLPSSILPTKSRILYKTATGLPLINRTEVLAPYMLKIVLNEKKGSFMALLCFSGLSMLSPDHAPANRYYYNYEKLVGTGPFELAYVLADVEQKIIRFDNYWRGPARLDSVVWSVFDDYSTRNQALLSGDVNVLLSPERPFFTHIENDPRLKLVYAGNTMNVDWITFNVDHIDTTMRKAISYAYNYTYIINVVYLSNAVRWPTYIPKGIQYANYSLNAPTFNRTYARSILLTDPIWGPICTARGLNSASTDADWINVAIDDPIFRFNYSWNFGNLKRQALGDRLEFDLEYIGVDLTTFGIAWGDLLNAILHDRNRIDSYEFGWAPDYLDPENYINPLWSNQSDINGGNYNVNYNTDTSETQRLMDAALTETDSQARKLMYWEIQRRMVEEEYPGMPILAQVNYDAWVSNFQGFISNPGGRVSWYGCYFTIN